MTDDSDDEWSARTPVRDFAAVEVRFSSVEKELRRQHRKLNECTDRNQQYDKQIAAHHTSDELRFERIDEKLSEIERRDEKRDKQDGKSRTAKLAAAGTIGAALITAAIAYYKVAIEKGEENATQRAVVDKVRELDAELDEVRALLWRLFPSPFTPGRPAGDVP